MSGRKSAMQIVLLADGSRGDILPYIPIARELASRGHSVRFVSSGNYAAAIQQSGIHFVDIGGNDPTRIWQEDAASRPTRNPVRFWKHLRNHARGFHEGLTRLHRLCQDADAVVLTTSTSLLAMALKPDNLPFVVCHLSPVEANFSYPRPIGPYWWQRRRWGRLGNWLSHALVDQLFWSALRPDVNAWRQDDLGLPKLPWWQGLQRSARGGAPSLFGISPALLPFPKGWTKECVLTGFWLQDSNHEWQPDDRLTGFLSADSRPCVFFGFGSHVVSPQWMQEVLIPGARQSGLRVILGKTAWQGMGVDTTTDDVLAVDYLPYSWIFERVSVVVHHCGVGTVAEALRAAVPAVLIPFSGEQRFWAERLFDAGVSAPPLNPRKLTAAGFAAELRRAIDPENPTRTRLRLLSQAMEHEHGVQAAVEIMERHFSAINRPKPLQSAE
jgi:sterol 3beta-glucosyltransferase